MVSPMNQLLLTLRLYSTVGHLNAVGDFAGVHFSTVSKIVVRVTDALVSLYTRYSYIMMLTSLQEIKQTQQDFYSLASFPRVIGAIDCTRCRIASPVAPNTADERRYNSSHIRTRNPIERLFGVLERLFPILLYGCRLKLETFINIIVAAAVLHNRALADGDGIVIPLPDELDHYQFNQLLAEDYRSIPSNYSPKRSEKNWKFPKMCKYTVMNM
nr:unnamed protein product [Callosobruchus analis]